MPFRQTTVSGLPAIALRSADLEVIAVPAIGMKLTNLRRLRGREWLWRNDQIPLARPRSGMGPEEAEHPRVSPVGGTDPGGSTRETTHRRGSTGEMPNPAGWSQDAEYEEIGDSGGWDECFPTVGASPIPGAPPGTPPLPSHGELWSARWTGSAYEHSRGTTLAGTVLGSALPYELHREVTVHSIEAEVRFRYRLRHTGNSPFPWIWSSHPLLNVQPGTTLELPTVRQVKVAAVHGRGDLSGDEVVRWPEAIGGDDDRFTFPNEGGWALKLFGDIGASGRMVVTDPRRGERLELEVRPDQVPQVGLWINCRGWAPPGRTPYYNLGLEPCIGAPDRLEDAVLRWGTAHTLAPGEERRWELVVRLPEDDR